MAEHGSRAGSPQGSPQGPRQGSPQGSRLLTPEFWNLATAASIFFLANGAFNAILPRFVVDELGGSEATAGFVMGSMAVSALLSRMWWGRIADRRGARRIMTTGAAITALAYLVLVASPTLVGAVVARMLVGAGGAAFMTGATVLSIDLAPPGRRSQAASYILIAFHVGLGIGPLAAEGVFGAGTSTVLWLSLSAVAGLGGVVAMLLPHRPGDPQARPGPLIHPAALAPGLVTLLGVAAFNGFLTFVPLYGREVGLDDVGLVFTVASFTIVVSRVLLSRVPDLVGPIRAGSGALVVTVVASALVALWATPTGVFVGAVLLASGLSLQSPSFMAVAVEGVEPSERGATMATFTASFDVANALVGPMVGLIVSGVGYRTAFLTAGLLSAVALAVLHLVVAPRRRAGVTAALAPS